MKISVLGLLLAFLSSSLSAGTPIPTPWLSVSMIVDLPSPYNKTTVTISAANAENSLSRVITKFELKTQKGTFKLSAVDLNKIKNPWSPDMFSIPFGGTEFSFICDRNQPNDFMIKAIIKFDKGLLSVSIQDSQY